MADPLSVAGTAVSVISLGIQVTQSLVKYYNSYRALDSDLHGTTRRLISLLDIFQELEKAVTCRKSQGDESNVIKTIEGSIEDCTEYIRELQDECKKFEKHSSGGIKATIKNAGRRVAYPFRQSTLERLDEDISEIRDNLVPALNVLQLNDNENMHDEIVRMRNVVDLVRNDQISSQIHDWLKAPDATIDHNAACAKKQSETGIWFLNDSRFLRWLKSENSFMWMEGFAGSGKSILCSTIIQSVVEHQSSDSNVGIAFFYFTFNDESKRDVSGMLRTLLLQFAGQVHGTHADLTKLWDEYKTKTPSPAVLIERLRHLIEKFDKVFVFLDALDECNRDGPREHVITTLQSMRAWSLPSLHLFVTSRDERDIRQAFDLPTIEHVTMQNTGIDKDIAEYVNAQLRSDQGLQKWAKHQSEIEKALTSRAKGVFRWAECQLKALKSCPCSLYRLRNLLNSLPSSLDETYERMLCNIEEGSIGDARRILTMLCFATRPLELQELIDGIAVEVDECQGLNPDRRLRDVDDILEICPGFIETNLVDISEDKTNAEIAQICLLYLLEPGISNLESAEAIIREYPLAYYASRCWYYHYKRIAIPSEELHANIVRLFQRQDSFGTSIKIYDPDEDREWTGFVSPIMVASSIYFASFLGLSQVLCSLIDQPGISSASASPTTCTSTIFALINFQCGKYGNALLAASTFGHEKVVQLLLDNGADVNVRYTSYGSALHAAALSGSEKVVQLLLDNGANVNAQAGIREGALHAASTNGYGKVVHLLLENGADVNAKGGEYGNALQAASRQGHKELVQLLLDNGADVNAEGGNLVLENGADVYTAGGYDGHALQAASASGYEEVMQLLLDNGANVNAEGGFFCTALQAAACLGRVAVVQMLLDAGADVTIQGGEYGSVVQAAAYSGSETVVQTLLNAGADVKIQGGRYSSVLQAAACSGSEAVIQLLINEGADVNVQGGYYGSALHAAVVSDNENFIAILLKFGADVNLTSGEYGTALQAAVSGGNERAVRILLDHGANSNDSGGVFRTVLQMAAFNGTQRMMELLLDGGADVNMNSVKRGSAYQIAVRRENEEMMQLLLDRGANPNL